MPQSAWHSMSVRAVFEAQKTSASGLAQKEAESRLFKFGPNSLPADHHETWLRIFLRQFASPLIFILILSAFAVLWLGDTTDAYIIFGVLFFNACIGAIQEGKAARSLEALKRLVVVEATVLRDGKEVRLKDEQVVPGDVLVLREGERISADARLIFAREFQVDEAMMTGESLPARKSAEASISENAAVADRRDMVFRGTYVVSGSAKAVVVETGLNTVIGTLAKSLTVPDTEMPLKATLAKLTAVIGAVVAICMALLFALGLARGLPLREVFTIAVSLAVSIIPEGLPIVLTIILASGVWRMARKHVLVRKLQAVEALGRATVLAVDKTGTITRNELMVERVIASGTRYDVQGSGYHAKGEVLFEGKALSKSQRSEIEMIGIAASACAGAELIHDIKTDTWKVVGDPTEAALGVFARKLGIEKKKLRVLDVLPFSYNEKMQAVEIMIGSERKLLVIGAPETILKRTGLSANDRKDFERDFLSMSDEGLRVVAVAVAERPEKLHFNEIKKLTFLGFIGMNDSIRREASEAVARCSKAGVKIVMITGDHLRTAEAIARKVGILRVHDAVMTGYELDTMTEKEFARLLPRVTVFARMTPEHKLRIIKKYRELGEIVAMTGDGVNDVPSLVAADLGVAMGGIGTDVTTSAAEVVLTNDNFANLIVGIEEGRHMYSAFKKVTLYLFSTNLGEALTIIGALFIGMPLPLLAAQIIWLNLVTDTFLDVSLAMEPKEEGLLNRAPRLAGDDFLNKSALRRMFLMAFVMASGTLLVFNSYSSRNPELALTMSLVTLAIFQWFNVWNCRSETKSVFEISPVSNRPLLAAFLVVIGLQLAAVYFSPLQKILHTAPLTASDWLLAIFVALSIIVVEEVRKGIARRKRKSALV
ncbi:MAG: HAD-IC family P-type ATPase [bacterium]